MNLFRGQKDPGSPTGPDDFVASSHGACSYVVAILQAGTGIEPSNQLDDGGTQSHGTFIFGGQQARCTAQRDPLARSIDDQVPARLDPNRVDLTAQLRIERDAA